MLPTRFRRLYVTRNAHRQSLIENKTPERPTNDWHIVSEYERRAEDAIEVLRQLALTRSLTPTELKRYACLHTQYGNEPVTLPPPITTTPTPPTPTTPSNRPHQGNDSEPARTPVQSKSTKFKGLMLPRHEVLSHPAGPDLLRYAVDGCPVDCGEQWSRQRIEAAIAKGAHASAEAPGAAEACRKEACLLYTSDAADE